MYSIIIYLTVGLQWDVMSSSGSCFQTAKLDVIPNRHLLKQDMKQLVSSFQNDFMMCGRVAKMLHIFITIVISYTTFLSPRVYRACLQRTSVFSLLTGALLEAIAALGARSALPYPFPQGTGHNSHAVLKGAEKVLFICVFDHARHKEGEWKQKCSRGIICLILRRRVSHYSPVVHHSFPVLLSHMFFFIHSGVCGSVGAHL